jgi:hypothetical protein
MRIVGIIFYYTKYIPDIYQIYTRYILYSIEPRMALGDNLRQSSHRIGGIAVLDTVLTIIAAIVLAALAGKLNLTGVAFAFVILIMVAIAAHTATNTPTMLNYYLGISDKPDVVKGFQN